MTTCEHIGSDVGEVDRLATIEQWWLEDADTLLATAPASEGRPLAQKAYVVTIVAQLEWEEAHGVRYDPAEKASRMNVLFHEGLYRAAAARDAEVTIRQYHDFQGWDTYLRKDVWAQVRYSQVSPANVYELAQELRSGRAWFEPSVKL